MLTQEPQGFDMKDRRWAEAYEEMAFYNSMFGKELDELTTSRLEPFEAAKAHGRTFPEPRKIWIDMPYDGQAQRDAFRHLADIRGQRVLQLGGHGSHAINFLLAGAREAWLITPIYGEALFGMALADRLGCSERLRCVIGIGEQIPVKDGCVDAVYAGGCLHHMQTSQAISEVYRVLAPGGKFAAVDPWKTLLHAWGTKVCGKREKGVFCKPLTGERTAPLFTTFEKAEVRQHGPFLRYLALGLSKFFGEASRTAGYWICQIDDLLPFPTKMGGSVALLGEKSPKTGRLA
jgi:SAM-dependent methyltransferase